jgi:protein tyrosine phosphatase (PTP) superfamily phosphohydrolase (DUF442 family)
MKKTATILLLWLFWGFAIGTFILLGPVRTVVNYAREHNWSSQKESLIVFGFIGVLIVVSFAIAFVSSKAVLTGKNKVQKGVLIGVPLVAAFGALSLLLNPKYVNGKEQNAVSEGFTIGPYPTKEKLEELKEQGYTTVISLLHPAVIPFEPKLLDEERENAKGAEIQMINIPLLPWISENEAAIEKLRSLVKNAKGKYYVHCYLGKDRVNVAKQIILQESKQKIQDFETQSRSLDSIAEFERGQIYKLSNEVYLTPMPTKEEYFGYIIAAGYKQVVALKDLSDPDANKGIAEEQRWLAPYKINLKIFDVGASTTGAEMKKIVDSVKAMPKPLVVHAFKSDQSEAQLFLNAFKQ